MVCQNTNFIFFTEQIKHTKRRISVCEKTWFEKSWKTLKDKLVHYNMLGCVPFGTAVEICFDLTNNRDYIFLKVFSVSGVAKLQMIKHIEKETFFCLFSKRHADLCYTMHKRNQNTGVAAWFSRVWLLLTKLKSIQ